MFLLLATFRLSSEEIVVRTAFSVLYILSSELPNYGAESAVRTCHKMPAIEPTRAQTSSAGNGELRFPPVTREHILHCSYDFWFPKSVNFQFDASV